MAVYKISFKASVDKDLSDLPKNVVARVWQRLELLKNEPFPRQALKLEGSEGLHRLRVGDYRIIYGESQTNWRERSVEVCRFRKSASPKLPTNKAREPTQKTRGSSLSR